jgi:hypothetical protein
LHWALTRLLLDILGDNFPASWQFSRICTFSSSPLRDVAYSLVKHVREISKITVKVQDLFPTSLSPYSSAELPTEGR